MFDSQFSPGAAWWAAIEPVWDAIDVDEEGTAFLHDFSRLRPEVGHLWAVRWCDCAVQNGGFNGFFVNSTGAMAPEALEGFRAVGVPQAADLLEDAMRYFGAPYPRDQGSRLDLLDAYQVQHPDEREPFDRLSERYFREFPYEAALLERACDEYARRVHP